MGTRFRMALTVVALLALVGCGSTAAPTKTGGLTGLPASSAAVPAESPSPEQEEPIAGPTQQATEAAPEPAASQPPATPVPEQPASQPPQQQPQAGCPNGIVLPDGVDPSACLPVTGSSVPFPGEAFKTPSGNAGCDLWEGRLTCTAMETVMADEIKDGYTRCDGYSLGDAAEVYCHGDAPMWMSTSATLQYGQVTLIDDRACTVSESGLTCWNTVTGHGFLLSRSRYLNW